MALKVKNPKKNLADILLEKERLNESYDSSSAVSLKTLGSIPEEIIADKEEDKTEEKLVEKPAEKPVEATKEEVIKEEKKVERPIQSTGQQSPLQQVQQEIQKAPIPIYDTEYYNPPKKKRGRPYQGYAENTHVQSIYVRNDLYEYIMVNYVGHGRKHQSFNKFVNAAINNYLRQLDENN